MMTSEENFTFINSYLSRMEPIIIENKGFIDKYVGDGIMTLFGGGADDAVKAGIAMLHQLRDYNKTRTTPERMPIKIGVGINTGSLMLGTVGGKNRMDGTVISDAVNLAARIESLTKVYQVSLLISHNTFLQLQNPDAYAIRNIGKVRVKGKSELVTVYEVFDADISEVKEGKLATLEMFAEGLSFYNVSSFAQAKQLFEECLRVCSEDAIARVYLQWCQEQIVSQDRLMDLDSELA
ncbi:MAG: adenylate/guanylate cyclase domain-containing protein [Okeania sp. SIO2H7]|nr:adenylate/guanylate cyclase domain-containing protein [Okeania sp. SIO2H7]